ncbi:MAG: hypothetical protein U0136_00630 [Bdellovibrionota bacterium]
MTPPLRLLLQSFSLFALVGPAFAEELPAAEQCDRSVIVSGGPCLEGSEHSLPGILEEKHRNVLGFILGKSDFPAARRIFGDAESWSSGDAAAAEEKLCYLAGDRESVVTVVVSTDKEMSSGSVDGLRIIRGRPSFENRCARTSVDPAKIQTRSGIHLGMSSDELKAILGPQTGFKAGLRLYNYCEESQLGPQDKLYNDCFVSGKSVASRCSGVIARFDEGGLKWFQIELGNPTC